MLAKQRALEYDDGAVFGLTKERMKDEVHKRSQKKVIVRSVCPLHGGFDGGRGARTGGVADVQLIV